MKPDLDALAKILDLNRSAAISERHWEHARGKVRENAARLEDMEKARAVSRELLDKPFTI